MEGNRKEEVCVQESTQETSKEETDKLGEVGVREGTQLKSKPVVKNTALLN